MYMGTCKRIIFFIATVCCFLLQTALAQTPSIELLSNQPLLLRFDYLAAGNTSPQKSIRFRALNLKSSLLISAPEGFEISKNNVSYAPSQTFLLTELSTANTLFVRFKPLENNKGYGGSLVFSSSNTTLQRPDLSASSIATNLTLDVVCWNLEWFGGSLGPDNNLLQAQHAIQVMDSLNADIYLLQEIVDTALLGYVSRNIANGPYEYAVSLFASNAEDPSNGNWRSGQKLAFLYKRNIFSNVRTRRFTASNTNNINEYNWANGRYPFRMDASVNLGGISKKVSFINLHAKAEQGDPNDYYRRKGAADLMYDSLTSQYPNDYYLIGGDYNDDLDVTISKAVTDTITPYYSFMSDDFRFSPISFWNSQRGDNSYVGSPNMVDHAIASYQMTRDYVPFSCVLRKEVTDWIPNYGNELSDHYPVESRFDLQQSPSNIITSLNPIPALKEAIQIINIAHTDPLVKFITHVKGNVSLKLMSADGRILWSEQPKNIQSGTVFRIPATGLPQGLYLLTVGSPNGVLSEKIIR